MSEAEGRLKRSALGFVRVSCVSPELRVADVDYNVSTTLTALRACSDEGSQIVVFPELGLTGYSCGDLFYQAALHRAALDGLERIAAATSDIPAIAIVGLPVQVAGRLYNCAAFVANGTVLGLVPKKFLPTTGEYYEERWFASGEDGAVTTATLGNLHVPFGADLLFSAGNMSGCVVGIEICEDLWAVQPPSGNQALAGATVIVNPSASNELLGKAEYRRDLVRQQSARCQAAYLYAAAGPGESTTDVVFSGHSIIAEYGEILSEGARFQFPTQSVTTDVDLQRLLNHRIKSTVFSSGKPGALFRTVGFDLPRAEEVVGAATPLLRRTVATPFVPTNRAQRDHNCREIFAIQRTGLAKRLRHVGLSNAVIGLSGGLDSTLALLVTIRAFETLNLPSSGIVCVSMPGMGTTSRTRNNALRLARAMNVSEREIPIHAAVSGHFKDIGHSESQHDVTYENSQARERTQILMDLANKLDGIVVGTGDLSELALGWCTYNGDQMSMYHVNAGVPKTLVKYIIEWCAECEFAGEASGVLRDIIATPITPELLPLGDGDVLLQETEAVVGPYVLHDFFLYHVVRHGFSPSKIMVLATRAFRESYDPATILKWMREFYRRFFSQQFKRSAMPDGPKVGSVALSPRGDWRMPSDASSALWLEEVDALEEAIGAGSRAETNALASL